ncbi:hypothetical protein K439DRAFT_1618946 [Ramaria rubella]|nr:hypothetical protein K439DRAFT_1618946 [Ramaria rubella]
MERRTVVATNLREKGVKRKPLTTAGRDAVSRRGTVAVAVEEDTHEGTKRKECFTLVQHQQGTRDPTQFRSGILYRCREQANKKEKGEYTGLELKIRRSSTAKLSEMRPICDLSTPSLATSLGQGVYSLPDLYGVRDEGECMVVVEGLDLLVVSSCSSATRILS